MKRLPPALSAALLLLALTACGHKTPENVAGVSPEEAAALNNAAETLDASADGMTISPNSTLDQESETRSGPNTAAPANTAQ